MSLSSTLRKILFLNPLILEVISISPVFKNLAKSVTCANFHKIQCLLFNVKKIVKEFSNRLLNEHYRDCRNYARELPFRNQN